MNTSWLSRAISLMVCFALLCSSALAAPSDWNTTIKGSMTERTEPQDDFFTYVNYDWAQTVEFPAGYSRYGAFNEASEITRAQVLDLLANGEPTSHEAELAQTFYRLTVDMDKRNADGVTELVQAIEKIEAIDSIEALSAYLLEPGCTDGVLLGANATTDFLDSTLYVTGVAWQNLSLSDPAEYAQRTEYGSRIEQANLHIIRKVFAHMGRTEEEGEAVYRQALEMEGKIAPHLPTAAQQHDPSFLASIYNVLTLEETLALNSVFPLKQMLETYGLDKSPHFIVFSPAYHAACDELYTAENLEGLKAMMIFSRVNGACSALDQTCLDIADEASAIVSGAVGSMPLEEIAYENVTALLPGAVGRMYVETYFSEETRQDVLNMIDQILAVYRSRLETNEWLSEETRKQAIHKLDSLTVNVGYGKKWGDYSALEISPDSSFYGAILAFSRFQLERLNAKVGTRVDRDEWDFGTHQVNAYYNPMDNSINILAGILLSPFYTPGGSMESNLGGIGTVIGHEITHAFDASGSQFDADGNMINWWTDEDRAAFAERSGKVADYFSSIELLPGIPCNGVMQQTEAVADLGGMSAALEIAKGIEGFDYKAFFEAYASIWGEQVTAEKLEEQIYTDSHPSCSLRTNVTLQQFEEFYETYGVEEEDGMYLAPEKRLSVW